MTKMRRKGALFGVVMLLAGWLPACTSLFGGEDVKVRPVENISGLTSAPRDLFYESAVFAISSRDYARALDYLQEARARDPRNIKALNALGVVYDKLGRFDLSARYYAQAHAVDPDSRIVAVNLGYSKILQDLLNPVPPTGVAQIVLPVDLNKVSPNPTTKVLAASAIVTPAAPSVEKPVAVPLVSPTVVMRAVSPNERSGHVVSDSAVVPPAKTYAIASVNVAPDIPAVVLPLTAAVKGRTVITVSPPAVVAPAQNRKLVAVVAVDRKVFTIGQPIQILNASGTGDRIGVVSRRLSLLGWTVRQSDAKRIQSATVIAYSAQNAFAAKAMQRTLPFPVRLVQWPSMSAVQLVIGRDYLSWKPKNARLAALWQRSRMVASLQKPSTKGAR